MTTRHLMFDFDGTLFDTAPDYALCFQELARLWDPSLPSPSAERIQELMFAGLKPQMDYTLGELSPERYQEALELFRVICERVPLTHTAPYPGILDALDVLRERGYTISICTNRPQDLAEQTLATLGLRHLFGDVVGGDAGYERKPSPEMIHALIERTGLGLEESVMIGDSAVDLYAAQAAGCSAALVTWGYTRSQDLAELGAAHVIDGASELSALFPSLSS